MFNIKDYIVLNKEIDLTQVLRTWIWLTGEDKTVIAVTKMGDAILKDKDNKLYHLDTGGGEVELKSNNYLDFLQGKLDSEDHELMLLPSLVEELEKNGKILGENQVYAFTKIPLIGGTYDKDNIYVVDLHEHYSLSGEVHSQLKDLPSGTEVKIRITE